jgi:hypothetical protein
MIAQPLSGVATGIPALKAAADHPIGVGLRSASHEPTTIRAPPVFFSILSCFDLRDDLAFHGLDESGLGQLRCELAHLIQ